MRQGFSGYAAIVAGLIVFAVPASAQSSSEDAIRQVQALQERAWNDHDARAFAQLLTDNADVIDVGGSHWQGRAETEAKLATAFGSALANTRLHIDDVKVRQLSDTMALAYVSWSMTGAMGSNGAPEHGIQTQLLQKTDGRWLIASFQNTMAGPERPVPVAAVPAVPAATPVAAPAAPAMAAAAPVNPATPEQADTRGCFLGTRNSCWIHKGK
jgi:uncharacterized protein (TIGR02246 family)